MALLRTSGLVSLAFWMLVVGCSGRGVGTVEETPDGGEGTPAADEPTVAGGGSVDPVSIPDAGEGTPVSASDASAPVVGDAGTDGGPRRADGGAGSTDGGNLDGGMACPAGSKLELEPNNNRGQATPIAVGTTCGTAGANDVDVLVLKVDPTKRYTWKYVSDVPILLQDRRVGADLFIEIRRGGARSANWQFVLDGK